MSHNANRVNELCQRVMRSFVFGTGSRSFPAFPHCRLHQPRRPGSRALPQPRVGLDELFGQTSARFFAVRGKCSAMKRRRVEKALKKRLRMFKARVLGESTKGMPKLTWRERQAIARAHRNDRT